MWEYLPYCSESSVFYSTETRTENSRRLKTVPLPKDWQLASDSVWEHWSPPHPKMRLKGWKIHISATVEDAGVSLAIVSEACIARDIPFKFLPTELGLRIGNAKNADRASSGKFITLYPVDDGQSAAAFGGSVERDPRQQLELGRMSS